MAIIGKFFILAMVCLLSIPMLCAQDDVRQQIRAIKMDQSYIKAEANDSIESVAAQAAALDLIYNYNAERMGRDLDTISIELIRPALQSLVYARGSIKRVLVFVELAVADSLTNANPSPKKDVVLSAGNANISQVDTPEDTSPANTTVPSSTASYGDLVLSLSNIEMASEAIMLLKAYKAEGKITDFGQLRSLTDIPTKSYLLVYDRERMVRAILSPGSAGYFNVKRSCPDSLSNYSGCGSLWFY